MLFWTVREDHIKLNKEYKLLLKYFCFWDSFEIYFRSYECYDSLEIWIVNKLKSNKTIFSRWWKISTKFKLPLTHASTIIFATTQPKHIIATDQANPNSQNSQKLTSIFNNEATATSHYEWTQSLLICLLSHKMPTPAPTWTNHAPGYHSND